MPDLNVAIATRDGVAAASLVTSTGAAITIPDNDGNVLVEVTNPTGGALAVTFEAQATVAALAVADVSVSIPAGATRWLGPWPPAIFNDADDVVTITAASGLQLRGLGL